MIYEDQLAAVHADSAKSGTTGAGKIDLALLVDGLQAEREQGITIDVAYRYFSTAERKFIIADTPGHEQYTRNMATGASTCDLAVILIDARYGVQTQTKRHSFIAALLGIRHIVVAINKMDLVDYSADVFNRIRADYQAFVADLDLRDIHFIPMSALDGDNVVNASEHMPWYQGQTLMALLNSIEISHDHNWDDARFPVQYVNRPHLDFRGFCGTIASGVFAKGDTVTALPSGKTSQIKSIVTFDGELNSAFAGMAVTLTLTDEIDVSRGDMLVGQQQQAPLIADQFTATLVWMTEQAMTPGRQYSIKLGTRTVSGSVSMIHHRIDVNTLAHHDADALQLNEIGFCTVSVNAPVVFDAYAHNKGTGAFIVIDRLSNVTVGAGMIAGLANDNAWTPVSVAERAARFNQTASIIVLTGQEAAQIAYQLERKLFDNGHAATVLAAATAESAAVIKQAGLIALCVGEVAVADLSLDADNTAVDALYQAIKVNGIVQ
jgi:sulfate adenylyltransferase large subunit